MESIHVVKGREVTDTPLVLFMCEAVDGTVEYWSTHKVVYGGHSYDSAVLRHNLFDMQSGSADGVDGVNRLALTLGNLSGRLSEIERQTGWKGARLTALLVFFDLAAGVATTESQLVFRGVANPPEEISEGTIRLSFANRLNLQRLVLPQMRIQRRCPWCFPQTPGERHEAVDGGARGRYSRFFGCGYSADVPGGTGNLDGTQPFTSCGYTRQDCEQRGMFDADGAGRLTRRFTGIEFVPSTIQVKAHGEDGMHASPVFDNEAKYNDVVPLVYGTAWYQPAIIFARNDGNLTHMEVLLGAGRQTDVIKVLVNGVDIPKAVAGTNMTATGWFYVVTQGARQGAFNPDFSDGNGQALGDPYGSLAVLGVVVPNRINDGTKAPKIQVLVEGLQLERFDGAGASLGEAFTNNSAWVLLDLLRRSGWTLEELDLPSFAGTAAYCSTEIETTDLDGNLQHVARSQCNLVLRSRRSAADVVRGVRTAAGLLLRYGGDGRLEAVVEGGLAVQQAEKPEGSNARETLGGGWPAYEFGDGTLGFGDIARRDNGAPSIRIRMRGTADSPNRFHLEFQDEFNEYQQDSLSLVDVDDAAATQQEVTGSVAALGVANFHQAGRVLRRQLDRSVRGNVYVDFETGLRGIGLKPGDLISLTYLREGYERQPFRVLRIAPSESYSRSSITAQIHDDAWYQEDPGGVASGRRERGFDSGLPRPLCGTVLEADGTSNFGITEGSTANTDGTETIQLAADYAVPTRPSAGGPRAPLVRLSPRIDSEGGTLHGGVTYYYAVSAVDAIGQESPLSFVVRAEVPAGADAASVTLNGLRFGPGTTGLRVYRGPNPQQLARIADAGSVAESFTDDGRLAASAGGPPDANFDHANFYWRLERVPETAVASATASALEAAQAVLADGEYRGNVVRIVRGTGAGQERRILANTGSAITVAPSWDVVPDAASAFAVVDGAWQFGALGAASPVSFAVPNRAGATVEICGRAANVHDQEAAYELSPVTRWRIGGAGSGSDAEVPPEPVFALSAKGQGIVEVSGIGFEELANTGGVTGATLTLHYLDEVEGNTGFTLAAAVTSGEQEVVVQESGVETGNILYCERELIRILDGPDASGTFIVERGAFGSTPAAHANGAAAARLARRTVILPFVKDFFGSHASGAYSYPVRIPSVRIAAAEMFATNGRGNSLTHGAAFTDTVEGGLRTLSGGQLTFQVEGFLAIQADAVPPLRVECDASVRDVRAIVGQASTGAAIAVRLRRNGQPFCDLSIGTGETSSAAVNGMTLPALREGDQLTLDVVSVGHDADTIPGRDLTVAVRL